MQISYLVGKSAYFIVKYSRGGIIIVLNQTHSGMRHIGRRRNHADMPGKENHKVESTVESTCIMTQKEDRFGFASIKGYYQVLTAHRGHDSHVATREGKRGLKLYICRLNSI